VSAAPRGSLLLVDDHAEVAWVLGRYLVHAGFDVTTCGDGEEALGLLARRPFDVVVTDVQMPKVNGLRVLDWTVEHRPETRVVVITGFGSPAVRQAAVRRGAFLYVEKPVDPKLLEELLSRPREADSFHGTVGGVDLFDYLQLLVVTRRQAVLSVTSSTGEEARIWLDTGAIVHGECGDLTGEEALFRCLEFQGGQFATLPWTPPAERTIDARSDFLLMEAARMKDERGAR